MTRIDQYFKEIADKYISIITKNLSLGDTATAFFDFYEEAFNDARHIELLTHLVKKAVVEGVEEFINTKQLEFLYFIKKESKLTNKTIISLLMNHYETFINLCEKRGQIPSSYPILEAFARHKTNFIEQLNDFLPEEHKISLSSYQGWVLKKAKQPELGQTKGYERRSKYYDIEMGYKFYHTSEVPYQIVYVWFNNVNVFSFCKDFKILPKSNNLGFLSKDTAIDVFNAIKKQNPTS